MGWRPLRRPARGRALAARGDRRRDRAAELSPARPARHRRGAGRLTASRSPGGLSASPNVSSMPLLLLKLVLAPSLVGATSLAGRRYGMRLAGVLGGLPVVVGPILLALALDHGRTFASGP